jgi:mannosyltransferase OCH1-like enzyme
MLSCDAELRVPGSPYRPAHDLYLYVLFLQTHHPGWQEVIWEEAAVLGLIQQDFPWFLDTYLSYPRLVQRSDVSRYMVLYKYGGVYLDADVSVCVVVVS